MDERVITSLKRPEDKENEALRPGRLADYIGQSRIKENLSVFIRAALNRGEALDHVRFTVPRGWAKRRWPILFPLKWASTSVRLPAPRLKGRVIWPPC